MTAYRIARASSDALELDELDAVCFPDDVPYPKQTPGCVWWLVRDDRDRAVAFAGVRVMRDVAFLCRAGVAPAARGRGLQRRLIRVRLRVARAAGLPAVTYTVPTNVVSANNLIRCGFRLWTPARAWAGRGALYWTRK